MQSLEILVNFILTTGILLTLFVLAGLIRLKKKDIPKKLLIVFWIFILINILHSYSALYNIRWFNGFILFLF